MPLKGVRYRFKRTKSGKVQRLAFRGRTVVEVTPYKRGAKGHFVKAGPSKSV
jgi:hypothetical protein